MSKVNLNLLPVQYRRLSREEFLKVERELYNRLCDKVDEILIGSSIRETCIKCSTIEPFLPNREHKGCCTGCKYLGKNGCTTKSLSCKLWFCSIELRGRLTELQSKQLHIIGKIGYEHKFRMFRGGIDDVFSELESGIDLEEKIYEELDIKANIEFFKEKYGNEFVDEIRRQ